MGGAYGMHAGYGGDYGQYSSAMTGVWQLLELGIQSIRSGLVMGHQSSQQPLPKKRLARQQVRNGSAAYMIITL